MKRRKITIAVIAITTIVSALYLCRGRDDIFDKKAEASKPQVSIDKKLQMRIDSFVAATPYIGSLGLKVHDITAQKDIYNYRENELMRPASCLKLLTCIAAIRQLGKSYTYKTRLYITGKQEKDTLNGDIILKTQFDPAFNRDSLVSLLSAIKQRGIKSIKGKVVLDMAFASPMTHEQHWILGDLKVHRMGLLYQGYRKLRIETSYALSSVAGINAPYDQIVFGRLNPHKATQIGQITTPLQYAIDKALKFSSNINAEGLLYPLGYSIDCRGNYRANGLKVLKQFILRDLKVKPELVCSIDDGCGLCPDNKVSANLLISLLKYAHQHTYIYNMVYEGLPLSGTDGTLYERLRQPNVLGKIKAKTGTLTREGGISSLSGFYTGADGHLIAFSIINNECPVLDGRWWQDKFCTKALLPVQPNKATK